MMLISSWGGTLRESAANETTTRVVGTNSEAISSTLGKADTFGADQQAVGWWVEIDVDEGNPIDTMRSAYSPAAATPEALVDNEWASGSVIRYLCLNAAEREMGTSPQPTWFSEIGQTRPCGKVLDPRIRDPLSCAPDGAKRDVVLQAVQYGNRLYLEQDDAADRGTGESSDAEFLRRLLESPSTASDSLEIELDWEEVGAVRYTYSLEGAADAIREAGLPCEVGRSGALIRPAQRS